MQMFLMFDRQLGHTFVYFLFSLHDDRSNTVCSFIIRFRLNQFKSAFLQMILLVHVNDEWSHRVPQGSVLGLILLKWIYLTRQNIKTTPGFSCFPCFHQVILLDNISTQMILGYIFYFIELNGVNRKQQVWVWTQFQEQTLLILLSIWSENIFPNFQCPVRVRKWVWLHLCKATPPSWLHSFPRFPKLRCQTSVNQRAVLQKTPVPLEDAYHINEIRTKIISHNGSTGSLIRTLKSF